MKSRTRRSEEHILVYGSSTIYFSVLYCDRKTLEIAVYPDSAVVVKAPVHSDFPYIERRVKRKAHWIFKQIRYFSQFSPITPERSYINGETHLYLGRQYRLKASEGTKNSVTLSRGFFHISCRNEATPNTIKKLLDGWYAEKARLQFGQSLNRCWQKFSRPGYDKPTLSIRRMKRRWGSLSTRGTLTLNTDLIKTPKECIDYVVMHELCHLKYQTHSPEFYMLLASFLPNWEKTKHRLESSMI